MIIRTVTAHCDAEACDHLLEIDTHITQVFHHLAFAGWSFDLLSDAGETYCPDHATTCPTCTPTTECIACLGDRTGHEAADMRLEESDR